MYQVTSANNPFFMGVNTYVSGFSFVFGTAVDTVGLTAGTTPTVWASDDSSRGLTPGTGRIFKLAP